jgi:hypothetical protein
MCYLTQITDTRATMAKQGDGPLANFLPWTREQTIMAKAGKPCYDS